MKHYKDSKNNIFGFDDKIETPKGMIEITLDEVKSINLSKRTEVEVLKDYTSALDNHLNSKATERGYDSIHTAALRAAVPLSPFHNEGMAYAIWMDECYQLGHQVLADVKSGKITLPTIEEFIASLPVLELPL